MAKQTKEAQALGLEAGIKLITSAVKDALKLENTVEGKWRIASERFVETLGINCFLRKSEVGYNKELTDKVYSIVADAMSMPIAPERDDKSDEAKATRETRQKLQMKVSVYINRMRSYAMGETATGEKVGSSKSPQQVFTEVADRIYNLYFRKSGTVHKASVPFARDIKTLNMALKEMAASNRPFSICWANAENAMSGETETVTADAETEKAPIDVIVAAQKPTRAGRKSATKH